MTNRVATLTNKAKALACALLSILLATMLVCPAAVLAQNQQAPRTVKVGFFHFDGYHEIDDEDNKSGYGYDFLQLVRTYANLNYDYVGYDKTWEDMQQMLLSGEIDMVTSARKTAEREKVFDFSSPIGTNSMHINVRSNETRFVSGNFSTYQGMTIGLLSGSSSNSKVEEFAKENGFTFEARYYDGSDQLAAALQSGEIDAVATSSLRKIENEKVISEFGTEYFYAIVRKGDTDLLKQINYAITQIDSSEGDWRHELYYKNYTAHNYKELTFSEKEKAFIAEHSGSGTPILVAADNAWKPFTYLENGTYHGIIVDIFEACMEMSGLSYTYYVDDQGLNDVELLTNSGADLYLGYTLGRDAASSDGLLASAPVVSTGTAYLVHKGTSSIHSVAICASTPYLNSKLEPPEGATICEYPDSDAAAEAVANKKVDAAFLYSHDAERLANQAASGVLSFTLLSDFDLELAMVMPENGDHALMGIVQKCLNHLSDTQVSSIVSSHVSYSATDMSLADYFAGNPASAALLAAILVAIVLLVLFFFSRSRANKKHATELQGRVDEITGLNCELEERQAQLEEAASEQEAQIEEITALNSELEERQAQLEEAASEQEAQIEEIANLNVRLEDARQAAESANSAKSNFLFSMSHDIRTPMNAIIGYADLMDRYFNDKDRCRGYLEKVRSSSDFLLSIINNVLEMARIESGKAVVDETPCNSLDVLNKLSGVYEELMREKGITFTVTNSFKTPYIYCDKVKSNEIFLNLLSNAYKYTPTGGSVAMDARELPGEQEGYVLIQTTIADTGIGMSEDYLPHLFEEFTREHTSTETKIQGTGLGMPIVKKLVEILSGTITVESKLGEGTTFVVTLPHRIAKESEIAGDGLSKIDPDAFKGKHILLAEDNDLNAEIATEILQDGGFMVERAEDGVVCVDMMSESDADRYDLVLMDIQMPNMNGYKAAQAIRKLDDPIKAAIPIIAMTANAFEEDRKDALNAGMDAHVAKPIDVNVLFGTIAETLQAKSGIPMNHDESKPSPTAAHVQRILSEMRQSNAVSVMPGGFFAYLASGEGELIYANETACKIWGCNTFDELKRLAGGTFAGMVHPDDFPRIDASIWAQIEDSDDMDQVEYRIVRSDGSIGRVMDYGRLVRDEDDGDVFYVFVVEITHSNDND